MPDDEPERDHKPRDSKPDRPTAEVHQLAAAWMRKDFVPTGEAMTMLWLADLRNSEAPDFRYASTQWLVYRNGVWQHDEGGAALSCTIGAFTRKVGGDIVKRTPRKEIESSRMHSGITMRVRAELARAPSMTLMLLMTLSQHQRCGSTKRRNL
jgi:hypothetical protein